MSIECTMPSAPRASPGIFKGKRGFGRNIKVPKSTFFFQYSWPFGNSKNVISKQREIPQNLSMFCKYLVADRKSSFNFRIAHSGFCLLWGQIPALCELI